MTKYQVFFRIEGNYTIDVKDAAEAEIDFDEKNSFELIQKSEHINIELEDIA